MRYLGLYIVRSRTFKCSSDHAKRSFYRAVNDIFGRIESTASEEVLKLIQSKCVRCSDHAVRPRGLSFDQDQSQITGFSS